MSRREYKYLIDEPLVDQIRREIAGICVPDAHATSGRYLTDTLYVDTFGLDVYRATIENERVRAKLRIRTYPETPGAPVFVEVKRRVDDVIVKARAALPAAGWVEILETGDVDRVARAEQRDAEQFFAHYHGCRRGPLVPQVMIRYEREPYTSTLDDYARLTFDRKIEARACSELVFEPGARGWMPVDHPLAMRTGGSRSYVVLELKFAGNAPAWMRRLVKRLELPRLAFSKYARGVEALHLAPLARVASL